jgi:hypothetical protein
MDGGMIESGGKVLSDKVKGRDNNFVLKLKKTAHLSLRINSKINWCKLEIFGSVFSDGINLRPLHSKEIEDLESIKVGCKFSIRSIRANLGAQFFVSFTGLNS